MEVLQNIIIKGKAALYIIQKMMKVQHSSSAIKEPWKNTVLNQIYRWVHESKNIDILDLYLEKRYKVL
jgi:hypothetical protein